MLICGCDEAGRGPLAGPVVAAAVILNGAKIPGIMDSKKLSAKRREQLSALIRQHAYSFAIAEASVAEIDSLNILQASLLAMQRAVNALPIMPEKILVDGNQLPQFTIPAEAIVRGDSKVKEIGAASILAKVYRDQLMRAYHQQWPEYRFDQHKGYPTLLHKARLQQYGAISIHRKSYRPVKEVLAC